MHPLISFKRIREFFLTYLDTAFRIRHEQITAARRALLQVPGTLCAEPFLEPIAPYQSSGVRVEALPQRGDLNHWLPGFSPSEATAFARLGLAGLLPMEPKVDGRAGRSRELYAHQLEMLRRGLSNLESGIVTSGTGSGKTEAFMLPIVAAISREALRWPAAGSLARPWWRRPDGSSFANWDDLSAGLADKRDAFIPRRSTENPSRPKAVRALILYPMNALVEDQLVRLRRALDSPASDAVLDAHFRGNRIHFGRYTGATPVTGHLRHPRQDNQLSAEKKLEDLFNALGEMDRTRRAAEQLVRDDPSADRDLPYNFARTDGSELISRWDMQRSPPDILITNNTMLSAMLTREVDEPIWDSTRAWLKESADSYFFLVLDELHLHRGTGGTETGLLIRWLLHRLGLDSPALRHKLRVLCSSASLPVEGLGSDQSTAFLHDMFADAGLPEGAAASRWKGAIVPGERHAIELPMPFPLAASELIRIAMTDCGLHGGLDGYSLGKHSDGWRSLERLLGGKSPAAAPIAAVAQNAIACAGAILACACDDSEFRPRSTSYLTRRIFGESEDAEAALEALLTIRLCGDHLGGWSRSLGEHLKEHPFITFRTHFFLRSIEGLFAAPLACIAPDEQARVAAYFGELSVERGARLGTRPSPAGHTRFLEVLYCECCGELFFGGIRSAARNNQVELLPTDPDPNELPERAKTSLFEQLSADTYAVFWPTIHRFWPWNSEVPAVENVEGQWRKAELDPQTGVVHSLPSRAQPSPGRVPGYVYDIVQWTSAGPTTPTIADAGTAVPHRCPYCGESYRRRPRGLRRSPIRNFRTGFAKTTQLLASELVRELHGRRPTSREDIKLVSFSDSRQDAATAALDIEKRHHEDLRREVLASALTKVVAARPSVAELTTRLNAQRELLARTPREDEARQFQLLAEIQELKQSIAALADDSIKLADVLDVVTPRPGDYLLPATEQLISTGSHPTDDKGIDLIASGDPRINFSWPQLFRVVGGRTCWATSASMQAQLQRAQDELRTNLSHLAFESIFNKTYFSFEEAGLSYPCLPVDENVTRDRRPIYDALLRVVADRYRFQGSQWEPNQKNWQSERDIGATNLVRRYAQAVWGALERPELDSFIRHLNAVGHVNAIIQPHILRLRVPSDDGLYYRCTNCGRVHLHRGGGFCTRCLHPLSTTATGTVARLRRSNYLASRALTGGAVRLHSEELTAATLHPGSRLRRFKGIFIDDSDDIIPRGFFGVEAPAILDGKSRTIDVLCVTTTMEVGVDIGALRAVFQANMPPQRYNYQQRVGRAGRRGQAFASVLTICRSKSHDLWYFRHPEKITGDQPPPPFLVNHLPNIATRVVRKAWLWRSFQSLRQQWVVQRDGPWPPDQIGKPDIHGEFLSVEQYFADRTRWRAVLQDALRRESPYRDTVIARLVRATPLTEVDLRSVVTIDEILNSIDAIDQQEFADFGLGEALAELGKLPMYGLPTRARQLYTGFAGSDRDPIIKPDSMDRDLEVAIHEFEPGSRIVRDKREHFSVGLTGSLGEQFRVYRADRPFDPGPAYSREFALIQCPGCGGWHKAPDPPQDEICVACGGILQASTARQCVVPIAFRTDFNPSSGRQPTTRTGARISMAEAQPLAFDAVASSNLSFSSIAEQLLYRLNRGAWVQDRTAGQWAGFRLISGRQRVRARGRQGPFLLENQWVDSRFLPAATDFVQGPDRVGLYLAAPKVTGSLFLAPQRLPPWVALPLGTTGQYRGAARAALISAAFLLVFRAAQELDVAPEDFEVIEPRPYRVSGSQLPVIQLCDSLVNGSGLCNRLSQTIGGQVLAAQFISSITGSPSDFPLGQFLAAPHTDSCEQSCYECLQRYGNQPYHGLLDWRLGLDYLALLSDAAFAMHRPGQPPTLWTTSWNGLRARLVNLLMRMTPAPASEDIDGVSLVRLDPGTDHWVAVVHPLWNWDHLVANSPRLSEFSDTRRVEPVSTFDIARRPAGSIDIARKKLAG